MGLKIPFILLAGSGHHAMPSGKDSGNKGIANIHQW
jgi:hypothetical protein